MSPQTSRAGEWFLRSGIQEPNGGVARYYRADWQRNHAVSTEITGYAVSAFVYLHSLTNDPRYLERAVAAARFLARTAWDSARRTMPFEMEPAAFTYFFDCGIVVRGLLSAWRATCGQEFLDVAVALGQAMAVDFASHDGDFHPILSLPDKCPVERDALRWSRMPGCYQLKSAMSWWELFEATGDPRFRQAYERVLEYSLGAYAGFLPGHADRLKVMDRLHAFCYFLEGMLPRSGDSACAAAIRDGIGRAAQLLREGAPEFERADVYAQVLRMRLYADWAGVAPLDCEAARFEAETLQEFQAADDDPRIDGGYYFGRTGAVRLPYVNPVSSAFAIQALELWRARAQAPLQMPI
ncbi:MAG TPA: hypothetical protein VKJ01_01170 [Candidatus Solibacter sp.]|nr:hypothetical protein [Candidatus Solibacter sp.]